MQKKQSQDLSSISRADIWIKSRTKKNGEPVNAEAGNAIVSFFILSVYKNCPKVR